MSAKYVGLSKYLLSQNSVLYARLVCFVNWESAFAPNLGIKSATECNCERGIMSPKGTPPARTDRLSINIEAAGSGNDPAREENLGLTCGTTSKRCAYARKVFGRG